MVRPFVFIVVYSLAIAGIGAACFTANTFVKGEVVLETERCVEPDRRSTVCRELAEPEEQNSTRFTAVFWAGTSAGVVLIPGAYLASIAVLRAFRRTHPGETKGLGEGFRFLGRFAAVVVAIWVGILVLASR